MKINYETDSELESEKNLLIEMEPRSIISRVKTLLISFGASRSLMLSAQVQEGLIDMNSGVWKIQKQCGISLMKICYPTDDMQWCSTLLKHFSPLELIQPIVNDTLTPLDKSNNP